MLMLLPLDKHVDWKHPPVITLLLIIVNIVIFYGWQGDDEQIESEALSYYLDSGLAELEAKVYPLYLQHQGEEKKRLQYTLNVGTPEADDLPEYADTIRYYTDLDYHYLQAIDKGAIVGVDSRDLDNIKSLRTIYQARLNRSTLRHYSLRPADIHPATLLTHQFLHADYVHLWGNMIFLFIVGYVVEAILGSWRFLLAYLLAGLGAASFDLLFNASDYNYHLGASGAVSGVMGMYAILFGQRKIQFFYNILFWVGRVKAPALVMLFIWIAKEITMLLTTNSNVNFIAHLGGLITGALVAMLLLRWQSDYVNTDYMDANENAEQRAQLMSLGTQALGEMKFDQARHHFIKLINRYPDDIEIIECLYKSCIPFPDSENYHKYARQLIVASIRQKNFQLLYDTWNAYNQQAKPGVRLSFAEFFAICEQLLFHNELADAEKLLIRLLKTNPEEARLASYFLQLAHRYIANQNKAAADKCARIIMLSFPDSSEAQQARSIVSNGL